jgi:23S rRNA (cytosine1962-C5)-methyltransferase
MDRTRVWPDFEDSSVLHDDGALLAIDKPVGVPSQAADPSLPDDVVTRLRAWLVARGQDPYLGVHQRLDRDTSGLLMMTRRRDVNSQIAAQFEGRDVEKTYLACVASWPEKGNVTLRHSLEPDDNGAMRVVQGKSKAAKLAVTHVKVRRREKGRVLLELVLETGRTHQARVQLATVRAPIAGDPIYGGPPAPRLLLHAHTLSLLHPTTKKRVTFTAPIPDDFELWMRHGDLGERIYDDERALERAIRRAVDRRFALGRSVGTPRATTAFRLINEGGDALPGLAVDVYGEHLVAQLYDGIWGDPARRERVLDKLHAIGADGIYLKLRPKQANTLVDTHREDVAPKLPVRGSPAPEEISVLEEGVTYAARLGDGLSTGIFLDQRANRLSVRHMSAGLSVANLFSYTCAFTVAAITGGAVRTVSVDASPLALERGRDAMKSAGLLDRGEHAFVAEDAFRWLAKAARKNETYDLVILDPPSYSTTRARRFVASTDYTELAIAALAILAPGGRLLACTNHRGINRTKFRRALGDAARQSGRVAKQIKDLPDPHDFPPPLGGELHLKSLLLTLETGVGAPHHAHVKAKV